MRATVSQTSRRSPTRGALISARSSGLVIAAGTAVVSGVAVAINGYGVRAWADSGGAGAYTTAKNLVAAAVLLSIATALSMRKGGAALKMPRTRKSWLGVTAVAVVGGSVPFLLFFEGLSRATSTNAAFLHKSLIVFVALLAVPLLKERLELWHYVAIGTLLVGQTLLAGGIGELSLGTGELMILGATALWSVEVIVAKRLLADVSGLTLGVARMGFGVVILVGYGAATGAFASLGNAGATHLGWVLLTGAILSVYVAGWYAALARAQAVDVMAVLVGGALVTAFVQTGFQGKPLPATLGLILVAIGVVAVFVGRWYTLHSEPRPAASV